MGEDKFERKYNLRRFNEERQRVSIKMAVSKGGLVVGTTVCPVCILKVLYTGP